MQKIYGEDFIILSAITQIENDGCNYLSHFNIDNKLYYQKAGQINRSFFPLEKAKVLLLLVRESEKKSINIIVEDFVFSTKDQKKMCRQYEKIISEETFLLKKKNGERI